MHRGAQHILILTLSIALLPGAYALAQVMQSNNYRIQSDSINVGGAYSSSSSYRLEDTAGEIATGYSSSTNYEIGAGYQQMQATYLAISDATNVIMSPSIGGITGGTANGSTSVTVTTDNPAGYTVSITASSSPAMQNGPDTIADYVPVGANPDFSFTTDPTDSHFGFSPEGSDIDARFKDNGASCNTGNGDTALACWAGLSTTPTTIVTRTSGNHPNGSATIVRFRVGVGNSVVQPDGIYFATTTLTALPL